MATVIQTRSLTKRYRRTVALDGVTMEVPVGAVYALVGANGAGKTTLIRLLMNIYPPSAGGATVLGMPSSEVVGHVFERIAYVSENQEMPDALTIGGLLDYVRPFYPRWDRELEAQLVRQFDLPLNRKLKHLSRGMRMKAALASVLAYRPSLVVLDEPFSGLDPLVRDELIESLKERAAETTVFLSSHDLSEIESFATHVGFLQQGRLLFSERLSVLSDRFREVEITLGTANSDHLRDAPSTWLNPQCSGASVRFVDSQFSEATPDELAARFPDAVSIGVEPMDLRSIFVAIARSRTNPEDEDSERRKGGMRQALHIFAKDVRLYWIEILATLSITALFVWVYPMDWGVFVQPHSVWPWVPRTITALVP